MNLALKEANKAFKRDEVPVGVIIVSDNKIVARGYNMRELKGDITKHAELIAIKKANKKIHDWRLENCTMYVTLFPCPMCASAIVQSRIKKIVIGANTKDLNNKQIVDLIFTDSLKKRKLEIVENVLEKECSLILKSLQRLHRYSRITRNSHTMQTLQSTVKDSVIASEQKICMT